MSEIFTTTLRLNLENEDDRRAYDYLRNMDRTRYRSYSSAIVTAINDHFVYLAVCEDQKEDLDAVCSLLDTSSTKWATFTVRSRPCSNSRRSSAALASNSRCSAS